MAKSKKAKKEGGASVFGILVLIFFILTTIGLGFTTYSLYDEQESVKAEAAKKMDEAKKDRKELEATLARLTMQRAIVGALAVNSNDIDNNLKGRVSDPDNAKAMMDEYNTIKTVLGENRISWPAFDAAEGDPTKIDKNRSFKPESTIMDIAIAWYRQAQRDKQAKLNALNLAKTSQDKAAQVQKTLADAEANFAKSIDDLKAQLKTTTDNMNAKYNELLALSNTSSVGFQKKLAELGADKDAVLADLDKTTKTLNDIRRQRDELRAIVEATTGAIDRFDPLRAEERKAEIISKDGNFVTINIGRAVGLRPQQRFFVVAQDASLADVLEREKALQEKSTSVRRVPFENNPLVKGYVEVVEITEPYVSRCKILFEASPTRNPIAAKDQVFNVAWTPNQKDRVAIAGIIDLNGDGLDDSVEFVKLLEKNNVTIDAFLDLKEKSIRGKGLSLGTKYLIMGERPTIPLSLPPEDPRRQQIIAIASKMSELESRAKEFGVQVIPAWRYMALIGVKPPSNPDIPRYDSPLYAGGDAPAPMPKEPEKN